jgi:acyl carrier protein
MCPDATVVGPGLEEVVHQAIAEVLMVPRASVRPDSALVAELGAESIDFLDLVFHLEAALHKRIPATRWTDFVRERLDGRDLARTITPAVVLEFAAREARAG